MYTTILAWETLSLSFQSIVTCSGNHCAPSWRCVLSKSKSRFPYQTATPQKILKKHHPPNSLFLPKRANPSNPEDFSNSNIEMSTADSDATAAFALLRQGRQPRQTTLAQGLAAEDQATNPWNGKPRSLRYFELLKQRRDLPASAERGKFLKMYQENQVLIVVGETGSGKTTQTPQHMYVFQCSHYVSRGWIANQVDWIACTMSCQV